MKANRHSNRLRIIGGAWRGRKLVFAPVPGLRPTPDRVRETLFNWLEPVIRGARCLDLFAGSGALGLEAASRGAGEVVLVDSHAGVVHCLQDQVHLLRASRVSVVCADGTAYLRRAGPAFDVVFLDPPFHEDRLPGCIGQLEAGGWLAGEAWVYLEAPRRRQPAVPANWAYHRSQCAGQVGFHLYRRTARTESGSALV
jgi:16S rRNA (guanine966-N2)-methyltransferase